MQRRFFTILSVVILAVGLAACGSDSDSSDDARSLPPLATAAITIENFTFTADAVKAGSTVTVANDDTATHSVVSDEIDLFGTEADVTAGNDGTITAPEEPGSYPFHCGIHSTMKSTLVVD